jgi:hypothetical protein
MSALLRLRLHRVLFGFYRHDAVIQMGRTNDAPGLPVLGLRLKDVQVRRLLYVGSKLMLSAPDDHQDPMVHFARHFDCYIHAWCWVFYNHNYLVWC